MFLKFLESESMITRNANNKRTAITIVNYDVYQYQGTAKEQQKNTKRTPKEHKQERKKNKNENNKFNNFQSREYNMEELEKGLVHRAVSYTHLDVYKRQALNKEMIEIPARIDEVSKQLEKVNVSELEIEKLAKEVALKKVEDELAGGTEKTEEIRCV